MRLINTQQQIRYDSTVHKQTTLSNTMYILVEFFFKSRSIWINPNEMLCVLTEI